jgi:hypothetical protein
MEQASLQSLEHRSPLFPLTSPEDSSSLLDSRRLRKWTLALLILGLAARCVRYFLRFPLWEDEAFLCVNLLDRDYAGLTESLEYHQVAPVLFLWLQLALTKLLGYHEMSLRLVSFLSGVGSLLLFWHLARRCLTGLPQLLAVALFSVTYACIRYSAEAKPYGLDLFVALVLITFMVSWMQQPGRSLWLWTLAVAIPFAVGLSYGAILLGGGLSLAAGWMIWKHGRRESLTAWLAFNASLGMSFLLQYFLFMRTQMAGELDAMHRMWDEHFPPLYDAGKFVYWLVYTHASDLLSYPAGGAPFLSTLSLVCWIVGLAALARRKQGAFLVLCLAPLLVTFAAAALRRYPYGGHIRLNLYVAPFMCMVIGYGMTAIGVWLGRRGVKPGLCLGSALIVLGAAGAANIVRDLAAPYKNNSDERMRAFAQWFWYNAEFDGEVACLKTDLGKVFAPEMFHHLNFSAQFYCNERIYSPRHAASEPIHWERIAPKHPLRCVLFRATDKQIPFDEGAFQDWLDQMQQSYDLAGRETYPMVRQNRLGRVVWVDYLEIFRFVPRNGQLMQAQSSPE